MPRVQSTPPPMQAASPTQAMPPTEAMPPARPMAAGPRRVGASHELQEGDPDLHAMLLTMADAGASDLHLTVGSEPMMRRRGALETVDGYSKLRSDSLQRVLFSILTQKQREAFERSEEHTSELQSRGQLVCRLL